MNGNYTALWGKGVPAVMIACACCLCGCKKPPETGPGVVPVLAAEVIVRDQPVYEEAIAETSSSQDVEIRARVEGFLETVNFSEGRPVEAGAVLYTIDPKPFEANLAQAKAVLAQAEATWEKAVRDTNRLGPLWEANAISRQQYDDAVSAEVSARANVQAAKASAEVATIQLGYTKIMSPISGLAGKNEVAPGNLVGRGASTLLTTISAIDPIDASFSVSEDEWLKWRRRHNVAQPSEVRGVIEMVLVDGTIHSQRGDVLYADRRVDTATGTLSLSARFRYPERSLRPGQFVRVRLMTEMLTNSVLVPQEAVQELQANYSVFVVTSESKAEFRRVEPGPRIGRFTVVATGLEKGEKVVIQGMQKLRNAAPVSVTMTNLATSSHSTRDQPATASY